MTDCAIKTRKICSHEIKSSQPRDCSFAAESVWPDMSNGVRVESKEYFYMLKYIEMKDSHLTITLVNEEKEDPQQF